MTRLRGRSPRRGIAFVPAMVCLVLVTVFCAALLRQSHLRRTVARDEERRAQADWLAESGFRRALARLAADRAYPGETWEIPGESLGGRGAGVVRVSVEPVDGRPGRRRVRVEADYPRDDDRRARHSKQRTVDLQPETPGGPR